MMADLVTDKLGPDAGTVLSAMLSHGRRYETQVKVRGRLVLADSHWELVVKQSTSYAGTICAVHVLHLFDS